MAYKRISPVPVIEGGTGLITTTTPYGVVCAGTTATSALQPLSALGASGTILTSNGASALPSFQPGTGTTIGITGDSGGAISSGSFTFTGGTTGFTFAGTGTTETLTAPSVASWTPYLTFVSGNTGITYTAQVGTYYQIGALVTFTMIIILSSKGSSTGNAEITLPIASLPVNYWNVNVVPSSGQLSFTGQLGAYINPTGYISLFGISSSGALTLLNNTNFTNTTNIVISGQYLVGG